MDSHGHRRSLVVGALAFGVLGLAATWSTPRTSAAPENDIRSQALDVLLHRGPGHPADAADVALVSQVVGEQAEIAPDGNLDLASGGCSTPIPLPATFEPACRTHDLGYEILRAGARAGAPMPPSARQAIDQKLRYDIERSCGNGTAGIDRECEGKAQAVYAVVRANSIRQRDGDPGAEIWPWHL